MKGKIILLGLLKDKETFDGEDDQCFKCKDLVVQPVSCIKCSIVYCSRCINKYSPCEKCKSKSGFEDV